jgi:hypothetical protein
LRIAFRASTTTNTKNTVVAAISTAYSFTYYVGTEDEIELNAFGDQLAVLERPLVKHPDPQHERPIRNLQILPHYQ